MVTFYQCLQEYLNTPGSYTFGKKDIQRISNYCRDIYDRKPGNPITYTQSIEGNLTFEVRNYPGSFKNTIMGILWRTANTKMENILKNNKVQVQKEIVKKIRKRVPVKKVAYSAKPA